MSLSKSARVLALVLLALGCRKGGEAPKASEDAVAMVGDRPITATQLQRHIDKLPPVVRQHYASAAARRPLVEALVRQELLLQEARRRGLERDPEYREIVDQQLIALLLRRALEGQDSAQAVRDADIEQHYRQHLSQFSAPELVRVSQIVVADKALAERLLKLAKQLRRGDAAGFATLAAKHSTDAPSRDRGGDVGFISQDGGPASPTIRANAFRLREPGDVSDLVETEHGFHIVRLTERRVASARPLAEVKEQIRQQLINERRVKRTDDLLAESRKRAKVQVFEDRLKNTSGSSMAVTSPKRDGK